MFRRSISIVAMLGSSLAVFASCVQAPPPRDAVSPASPSSGETSAEVSFMVFGDPAEKNAYDALVSAFEAHSPQVNVTLIHIPSQDDYRKRLAADFAAGAPPDVFLINYRRYGDFAAKGVIEPLDAYFAQSKLLKASDFYPEALEPFTWRGKLACVPQNVSSLVVYYNKDLFDKASLAYPKPDWTWDDFLKTAQALTKDTDGDGKVDEFGLGTTAETIRLAPFIWQNGGTLVDNPAAPTKLTLDTPESKAAFQWFVDLQVKYHVAPDAVGEEAEDSESRFGNGRLGMLLQSRRIVPALREIKTLNWDVAPLPRGKQPATILHSDAYCVSAASEDKAAVWSFVEFANSAEGQTIIARTGRTVPSLRTVAESPAFLDLTVEPKSSHVFLDVIPYIQSVPVMSQWPAIEDALSAEIQRAFYGQASVDEAIKSANEITQPYFAH